MYKNIGFCTFVQTILQSHHSLSHHNKLGLTNLLVGKPLVTLEQVGEVGV